MATKTPAEFALREIVCILACGADAIIDAILLSGQEVQYRVNYWWEGQRYQEWVYAEEIEKHSDTHKPGEEIK